MTQKTCFFIGHHDAPADLAPVLAKEVERHITEYGVSSFITGMYGSFDQMAMRAVAAAKKQYPWVRLSLLLPYHPEERKIEKPKGVDELYYPDGLVNTPRRFAIVKANEKVIAQSDFLNHRRVSGDGSSRLFSSALWSQAEPFSPAVHHQGVNESRPSPTAHPVSLVAGCFCLVFYNKSVVY